jgi:hypothetical protein
VYDVGTQPGTVFAVPGFFGGDYPPPSALCSALGTGWKLATSTSGIDDAKLASADGWYFADVYGSFNEASQQVSCDNTFGEPAIFGVGVGRPRGVKTAQPSPCSAFTTFYACESGYSVCGSGPKLDTTVSGGDGLGVLCTK